MAANTRNAGGIFAGGQTTYFPFDPLGKQRVGQSTGRMLGNRLPKHRSTPAIGEMETDKNFYLYNSCETLPLGQEYNLLKSGGM
jgi:hypothetical protein